MVASASRGHVSASTKALSRSLAVLTLALCVFGCAAQPQFRRSVPQGAPSVAAAAVVPVSARAEEAAAIIDAMDVEHRWPAGERVNWETGIPDGEGEGPSRATHCSAFVAAAAEKLGIYILRPPEHSPILLADAQYDWLSRQGMAEGWKRLDGGVAAQNYANEGWFVVAVYREPDVHKPGHIAIVRPSEKSPAAIAIDGPQETQAGARNYRSIGVREGFSHHRRAFADNEIAYFAHAIDPAALSRVDASAPASNVKDHPRSPAVGQVLN